jgi:hypothetical protein
MVGRLGAPCQHGTTLPNDSAATGLQGGADDKAFRLDRTGLNECASLIADRKELAAMRHK